MTGVNSRKSIENITADNLEERIRSCRESGCHLFSIQTQDKRHIVKKLKEAGNNLGISVFEWSFRKLTAQGADLNTKQCGEFMQRLREEDEDEVKPRRTIEDIIKHGLHGRSSPEYVIQKYTSAKLPESMLILNGTQVTDSSGFTDDDIVDSLDDFIESDCSKKTIVFVNNDGTVPLELYGNFTLFSVVLPKREEMLSLLRSVADEADLEEGTDFVPDDKLLESLDGLTFAQAEGFLRHQVSAFHKLDGGVSDEISELKRFHNASRGSQTPDEDTALNRVKVDPFDKVGGLDVMKKWLRERVSVDPEDARNYGLKYPKGMLLIGPPGCGKSLASKAAAIELNAPLYQLDVSKLFNSYLGESEKAVSRTLDFLDSAGSCVLWIDEIEKLLPFNSSSVHEVTMKVCGQILSWMQDRPSDSKVFVVATANKPDLLPTEIMRKGRLDQVFYVDLPSRSERLEIFEIHLRRINKPLFSDEMMNELADLSSGYTGAEIEAAVNEANLVSFGRDKVFTFEDVKRALLFDPPLSEKRRGEFERYKEIGMEFAVMANSGECVCSGDVCPARGVSEYDCMYQ